MFSAPTADGLGNLPGRALFPRIISTLQGFTEADNKLLVSHLHMSYKPFISIFSGSRLVQVAVIPNGRRLMAARFWTGQT